MTGAGTLVVVAALWPAVAVWPAVAPGSPDSPPPGPASALQTLAAPAGGVVGFAAVDLASGQWIGLRVDHPFPMQSVFKLPVALEVLHAVDEERLALDRMVDLRREDARDGAMQTLQFPSQRTVRQLFQAMLIQSDNAATDKLLGLIGGAAAVDARVRALGVTGISVRYSELEMTTRNTDNTTTPRAMLQLLRKIADGQAGLSRESARLLDDTLIQVVTGPNRIKGALPPGTVVAHKTGTSRTTDGITDATNDVGLVTLPDGRRIAVAAFVHASPADLATREAVIAALARAAYERYVKMVGP